MEITKDKIIKQAHDSYAEYELSQFIVKLDVGQTLKVSVNDTPIKEYTARYIKCHIDMTIQDKGIKQETTILKQLQAQKADLEEQIKAELEK